MRLLILAYDFPPNTSVGAQRPYGWFKYLRHYGIHPVVVTRHWEEVRTPEDTIRPCGSEVTVTESEEGTVIRVPYRPNLRDQMLLRFGNRFSLVRKMLSLWFLVGQYFLRWADNRRNILDAARSHLRDHPVDAIIATGEPFVLFSYASRLSKEFGVPWIGDYRDGWSMNYHAARNGALNALINEHVTSRLEKTIVSTASAITVAAPELKEECGLLLPGMKVKVMLNGFFEEMFEPQKHPAPDAAQRFTIIHSGTLYPYQPVEIFLDGLKRTINQEGVSTDQLQVVFLGMEFQDSAKKRVLLHAPELEPYFRFTERMPHQAAITEQRRADLLLLMANAKYRQIYAKVFDYVALGTNVLFCQNDHGPLECILRDTGTGIFADTAEEVCAALTRLIKQRSERKEAQTIDRTKYSRRHQTGVLAELIRNNVVK